MEVLVRGLEHAAKWIRSHPRVERAGFRRAIRQPLREVQLVPKDSYVSIAGVEKAVRASLYHDLCGVHLLPLPPNSGKTTVVRRLANKMLDEGDCSGIVYLDLEHEVQYWQNIDQCSTSLAVARCLDVSYANLYPHFESFRTQYGKPVVVIVDNADDILLASRFRQDLVSMATTSNNTRDFIVMMLFRRVEVANVVRSWNGNVKIHLVPRPSDLDSLVPTDAELKEAVRRQQLDLEPAANDMLIRMSRDSQSVGFVAEAASLLRGHEPETRTESFLSKLLAPDLHVAQTGWKSWREALQE
jgi:hypothetical protein